jgi:hypothetical protein
MLPRLKIGETSLAEERVIVRRLEIPQEQHLIVMRHESTRRRRIGVGKTLGPVAAMQHQDGGSRCESIRTEPCAADYPSTTLEVDTIARHHAHSSSCPAKKGAPPAGRGRVDL